MKPAVKRSGSCILCGSRRVEPFLDLGETALANRFLSPEELSLPEPKYPLEVGFCHCCRHVQLTRLVPPEDMFDHYLYISAASDTLKSHLWELSDLVTKRCGLGADDLVIDIGCNDGTLLCGFRRYGLRALGVDPARNLAELGSEDGIERCTAFFGSETAKGIVSRWGPARAVTATNTFPHIQNLADFVEGIKTVLAPDGFFVIEMHYLLDLVEQVAFDTIYHEHVSYWALGPMIRLFERQDMDLVDAERLPLHHGQLRVFVARRGAARRSARVDEILEGERKAGLDRFETYREFAERSLGIRKALRETLIELRRQRKRVAGYGAPAKGNTLLSFSSIGPELVEYIADRSPLKQGLYTPGTHIPVVPPRRLLEDQPDYLLLLAWNFLDEIAAQQAQYRARGGRFIVPVPEVAIV